MGLSVSVCETKYWIRIIEIKKCGIRMIKSSHNVEKLRKMYILRTIILFGNYAKYHSNVCMYVCMCVYPKYTHT